MTLPTVLTETVVTYSEATEHCPKVGGKKVHRTTVRGWCENGILVGGQHVKLESARHGRLRVTSVEAIERFFFAINGGQAAQAAKAESPAVRKKASQGAMDRLRKRFAKV